MSGKHIFDERILRAYDIRGEVGSSLREEDCYAVGRAYGSYVLRHGGKHICIGFDGRESSPIFAKALLNGLLKSGIDVTMLGIVPTPTVYFAMHHLNLDACVVVTGSHSPITHNGIKMALRKAPFYGGNIQEIGKIAAAGDFENAVGSYSEVDIREKYVDRLLQDYDCGAEFKIIWDAGNGAAGAILDMLTTKLAGEHTILFGDIDSSFPNHHPDPTVEKNLEDLQAEVKKQNADIGIGFDGDADRIGVIDENTNIIWADILMAIYAGEVLKNFPSSHIIADVKSSRVLFDEIKRLGGIPVMWQTGHSVIKAKMKELNSPLAGELAGHICFADKYFGFDDGIYAAIRILNIMGSSGKKLSELTEYFPKTCSTPEIRFEVPEDRKFDVPKEILNNLKSQNNPNWDICDIDGIRLNSSDGWWLLRASNTESVLTARIEAFNQDGLDRLKNMLVAELAKTGIKFPDV